MAAQPLPPSARSAIHHDWIDVSVPIRAIMPVFPGEPAPALKPLKRIAFGANNNVSSITLSLHAGTHVDAPWHCLDTGHKIDNISPELLCGPARVIEITHCECIDVPDLRRQWQPTDRILFKTRNSKLWRQDSFHEHFVFLTADAARWLADRHVVLVGVDYLSIERFGSKTAPAHKSLLSHDVVILEGLDLSDAPAGSYEMVCLPLKIADAEAAPARVLLRRSQEEL